SDCDVVVPAERLGAARVALVEVDATGEARLVVPENAAGTLALAGQPASAVGAVCARAGRAIPLATGVRAELEIGGVAVSVAGVRAGKKVAGRVSVDGKALPYQGLSLLLHGAILAATAFFMPPMAMADEGTVTDEQRYFIQQALQASAERDQPESEDATKPGDADLPRPEGGTGQRAAGSEGKMGSFTSKNTDGRWGIYGDKSNKDTTLSRQQALEDAANFGFIGVLASVQGGPLSPTAPWGADVAVGNDPKSALGNMWGTTIDDAAGAGGLGLSGIGEGGGCRGGSCIGVGLGNIGGLGHGAGLGDGQGFGPGGFGRGHGHLQATHHVGVPVMHGTATSVNGRLPPEVIQRVVRQNFGRFRLCYENGLRAQPSLAGRVAVRFVIGHDGSVSQAANGGSDLPDAGVVSCVTRAFYGLSFPAPDGGIVTVTYPIAFSPGA
ncbi:MAG TPA: AgmX/PglI C-terminal domain-containing protein, partial [Minicystis sp.]|nr:AgmX/PglI C-terminal domain-containing protein [Minicystis sp.]